MGTDNQTWDGISPSQALEFYSEALAAGFTSDLPSVTFNYDQVFNLSGHGLKFLVQWHAVNQTITVTVVDKPFFVSYGAIFEEISALIIHPGAKWYASLLWTNLAKFAHPNYQKLWRDLAGVFARRRARASSFAPAEVADLYGRGVLKNQGEGQTINYIELGGGVTPADLEKFQAGSSAQVSWQAIEGATNNPDDQDSSVEVMLDVEVGVAVAPKAKHVVWFGPNTSQGFLDTYKAAAATKPTVISISWGQGENLWEPEIRAEFDAAITAAAAQGIATTVAAGDNGSSDGEEDGSVHVDFPASAVNAIACGGTELIKNGSGSSETAWNDGMDGGATGGGVSTVFAVPSWQADLQFQTVDGTPQKSSFRIVPDVAGNADPRTGYEIFAGEDNPEGEVVGGTSAVAPLWAGLIALVMAERGGKPFSKPVNQVLYDLSKEFNENIPGNNGKDESIKNQFDSVTGLGTPTGALLTALVNYQ
jgi:kumamolisin